MALLHRADLQPTKLELLTIWLPGRSWYPGPATPELSRVASFRFDDPDGEVGVETIIVSTGDGRLLQTPLTYRAAPLDGHDRWLLGTTEHSVLGRRWVYDACGDPVYTHLLSNAIRTGTGQAEEFVDMGGRLELRAPSMVVRGSGSGAASATTAIVAVTDGDPTAITTDAGELAVIRVLAEPAPPTDGDLVLTATWDGLSSPQVLAIARNLR